MPWPSSSAVERPVEVVDPDRDVPVRGAEVVRATVVVVRQLEDVLVVSEREEVVRRLELAVSDDVHVAGEAEAECLVEAAAPLGIGDANHGVQEIGHASTLPVEAPVGGEELEHVVVGERAAHATLAAHDLRRGPERVENRLLGCVDDGLEDVVEVAVWNRRRRGVSARSPSRAERTRRRSRRSRGGPPSHSAQGRGQLVAPPARAGATRAARRRRRPRCSFPPSSGALREARRGDRRPECRP